MSQVAFKQVNPTPAHHSNRQVVAFHPEYIGVTGDIVAAYLLSQLVYWYQPDKHGKPKLDHIHQGKFWISKTYKEWAEDLHLTPKQVIRAMGILREKGLVVCDLVQRQRLTMNYYRLECAEGAPSLKGYPVFALPHGVEPVALQGKTPAPQGKHLILKTTEKTTVKTKDFTDEKPSVEPDPKPLSQGTPPSGEVKMATAQELLAKHTLKQQEVITATPKYIGPAYLALVWKKLNATSTGTFAKEPTTKEVGQLKHVLKGAGPELALAAVRWCFADPLNWLRFIDRVKSDKGLAVAPGTPSIAFFSTHYDVVLQLIAKAAEPLTNPTIAASTKPAATSKIAGKEPEHKPITLAEIEAMEQEYAEAAKQKG